MSFQLGNFEILHNLQHSNDTLINLMWNNKGTLEEKMTSHLAIVTRNTMPPPHWLAFLHVLFSSMRVCCIGQWHCHVIHTSATCGKIICHRFQMGDCLHKHMLTNMLTHGQTSHMGGSWWLLSPPLCVMGCHSFSTTH